MTPTDARPVTRVRRLLAALMLTLGLLALPVAAQNAGVVTNANDAFARMTQLANDVRAMQSVAKIPLGPYDLNTDCTWCSAHAWWGLGTCTENTRERWGTKVDFSWTRGRLNAVLEQAEQNTTRFPDAFASIQKWTASLPAFTAEFDRTADIILNIHQQIKAGTGPNDQQRQAVTQALQTMINDLSANAALLTDATKQIAAALQSQSAFGPEISQAIQGADASVQAALASVEKAAGQHHCQDGLQEKYQQIKAGFSNSLAQISAAFQRLEASRKAADQGLAFLLGSIVSLQTDLQSVMTMVKAAGTDKLGSFLEQLHLAAAKTQLQQIAASSAQLKQ
jgi:hypothetical protein